ncbi:hypothetical protein SCALM49S_02116 [Streptomyces californicus]
MPNGLTMVMLRSSPSYRLAALSVSAPAGWIATNSGLSLTSWVGRLPKTPSIRLSMEWLK